MNQLFIIADIVEGALLGLNLINLHKVVWDHWQNHLSYGVPPTPHKPVGSCRLIDEIDLPGQCAKSYRVRLIGEDSLFHKNVLIQADLAREHGLFIRDTIASVKDGVANILIGNHDETNYQQIHYSLEGVV